jgi:glycosyltransferase involved in cell wall biosynthesis
MMGPPAGGAPPRVSIGFPVRNAGPAINAALESLLAQDFADFELIISDNASTDETPDVCRAFARMDRRIRFEGQPRNVGLIRNFEHVLGQARAALFMWAAHDDRHDASFVRRCVAALDRSPEAVLATTPVEIVHARTGVSRIHPVSEEAESGDVVRRLRWVWRDAGWMAIYGLIRREALARTRAMTSLPPLPRPGLGPDYRVIELAILGPFARVSEPLFHYRMRDADPLDVLADKLDPDARYRGTMVGWWLRDMWRLTGRHHLDPRTRLRVQAECLASTRATRSMLHIGLLRDNAELRGAAIREGRWRDLAALIVERGMLGRSGGIRPVPEPR